MELWPHSQSLVRRPCRRTTRPTDRPTNSGSASSVSSARARPCPSASAHCSPPPPPSKSKGSGLHVPDNLISHMEGKRDLREGGREKEKWEERDGGRGRALGAKPWKLPSELVVSAISSVAAIFMVAISRLHGVDRRFARYICLQQNEPQ